MTAVTPSLQPPRVATRFSSGRICFDLGRLWALLAPLTGLRLGGGGTVADAVLFLAFMGTVVLVVLPNIRIYQRVMPTVVGILLLGSIVAVATLPVSDDRAAAAQATGTMFAALVAIVVVLYVAALKPDGLLRMMDAYTAGAVLLSLSAWVVPAAANGRAAGLAGNPVEVGGASAAALAYLIFRPTRGRRSQVIKWSAVTALASSFLAAQTVTGPLAVAVAIAILLAVALPFRLGRTTAIGITLLVAFWIFLWFPAGQRLWEKLASANVAQGFVTGVDFASQTTFQSRLTLIALGVRRIEENPWFGYGLSDKDTTVFAGLQPHNAIVLAWVAGGVPLMAAFVGLLVITVVGVLRLRGHAHPAQIPLAAGACAAWVGALSGPALYQRPVLLVLLAFVTAVVVHERAPSTKQDSTLSRSRSSLVVR